MEPLRQFLLTFVAALALLSTARGDLTAIFNSATDVGATASGFAASGTVALSLGYAPVTGTNLLVVKNTGLGFITGAFSNLVQGQAVALSFGGVTYHFVANYYGGTGNDLVLQWASVRPLAWGDNSWGQLGNNSTVPGSVPAAVLASGVLAGKTVVAVAAGGNHSVALCSDGTIAAWGSNNVGQLGTNSMTSSQEPVAVNTDSGTSALFGKTVVAVAAGAFHSVALCADGTLAAWGYNGNGQLGNNSKTNSRVPVAVSTASGTSALFGKTVVAVAAGYHHTMALCADGTVAAWGYNYSGELGNNSTTDCPVPVSVNTDDGTSALFGQTVVAVAAGAFYSVALCADGTVAAWGYNYGGQLGNNGTTDSPVPVAVDTTSGASALFGRTVVAVAAGGGHSVALCSDGTVAAWGSNYSGQLGNNSMTNSQVPVMVNTAGGTSALSGQTVVAVAAGASHSMALCADGTLVAWGRNTESELGNNSTTPSQVPVALSTTALAAGERWTLVGSGATAMHTLALAATPPDTTPPTLSPITISSNNASPVRARTGDMITVSFTASEAIQTPTVTIAGRTAMVSNLSGNSWIASITAAMNDSQGAVTFSIASQDLAGNNGTTVTATTDGSSVTINTTAPVKGAAVPGGGMIGKFGFPQPGAFAGTVQGGNVQSGAVFAPDETVLLKVGGTIGGLPLAKLGAPDGDAVLVTLKTGGSVSAKNNIELVTGLASGTPAVAARTGTVGGGLPAGLTIQHFLALDGQGSTTFALVTLQGTGVTAANNTALLAIIGPGQVNLAARKGQSVTIGGTTRTVTTLATLVGSSGTLAANRWRAGEDSFGLRVTCPDKTQAIFVVPATAASAADWTLTAETGAIATGPLAGTTVASFGLPGFGSADSAQVVNLKTTPGAVTAANDTAISSGATVLARKGAPAPDASGAAMPGVLFKTLADPLSGGAAAFAGTLSGTGVKATNNRGLWYAADGATTKLLARTGDAAPGGGHWNTFSTMVLPDNPTGGPIFLGTLTTSVADPVTAKNNLGLWAVDSTGTLQLIFRTGQNALVNGVTRQVKTFTALVPGAGSIGAASGYDNKGHVAVLATFTDGTQALLVLMVP